MGEFREWDMMEMDVLREIGTIAASYGTDALTKMLNKDIKIYLPEVLALSDLSLLANADSSKEESINVICDILAGLNGRLILTFDRKSAGKFINLCYPGYPLTEGEIFTELGVSALKEVGNIVLSAYVNALSVFLKLVVVPSPPTVSLVSLERAITEAIEKNDRMYVLLIDAVFEKAEEQIKGRIEFLLTRDDRELIHDSCRDSIANKRPWGESRGSDFSGADDVFDGKDGK